MHRLRRRLSRTRPLVRRGRASHHRARLRGLRRLCRGLSAGRARAARGGLARGRCGRAFLRRSRMPLQSCCSRGRARPFPASEAFVPRRGSSFFGAGFARSGSRRASARAVPPRCGAKASRCGTHSSGISGRWPGPSGARLTSSLAPSPFPRSTAAAVIFWASSSESPPRPFRLKGLRSTCPTNPRATCL